MDHDQFAWSSQADELATLLDGLNSSQPHRAREGSACSDQGVSPPPSHAFHTTIEASTSGVVRTSIQQPMHPGTFARPFPQRRIASASQVPSLGNGDTAAHQTSFEPPLRSIFLSGPPTASVSANTAHASLSASGPSASSGPVAALTSASVNMRTNIRSLDVLASTSSATNPSRATFINPEKDDDDPTNTSLGATTDTISGNTSATVAKLFATCDLASPDPTYRSYTQSRTLSAMNRPLRDTSTLPGHLFYHGYEQGRHSDIAVHAFGHVYRLHKILLDRVPYFASAFSGPWAESTAREMRIAPEETDSNITKTAFELALKRIYGTSFPVQEEDECIGLFATACWLDMPDLVDSCVDSILRQMQPSNLHTLIKLVTNNYYGKAGDRVLSSAKAMLCREGWEMPYECWDEIPAEIVREIVGGDPFFVPGEWERWYLALKLLNRRIRAKAVENGLVSPGGQYLHPKPKSLRFFAVRFDTTYHRAANSRYTTEVDDVWVALYTSPEIAPILVLLDEGVHYVHLRFEQLQQIRGQRDILGVPILPEKVISDALWMSMELRQKVLNSSEEDIELGISETASDYEEVDHNLERTENDIKGKCRESSQTSANATNQEMESGSWDGNGRPRKFWIPSHDVSCVMGGTREACLAANVTTGAEWTTHAARLSASLEPADVAWALDFNTGNMVESGAPQSHIYSPESAPRYSHYPPFRFSAEFPNPRTLKEKKRVYSQTVWYAGSMWNLYIQRVHNSKTQQLGIYLHRAKDKDPCDDPLAQFIPATVDDRIGQLERAMLLRKNERRGPTWRADQVNRGSETEREEDSSGSIHDNENASSFYTLEGHPNQPADVAVDMQRMLQTPAASTSAWRLPSSGTGVMLDSDEENEEQLHSNRRYNISAIPPYMDARPTIKTYFKIYSPSKAGRLLSIYESAPDKFDVSKSWGWKSSQMQLDDGLGECDVTKSTKDGKLRYMVVIGNI